MIELSNPKKSKLAPCIGHFPPDLYSHTLTLRSPHPPSLRARGAGSFLSPSPPPLIGRQPPHRRSQSARPSVSRGRFSAHLSRCSPRRQIRTDIVVCLANETNNDSGTTPVIIFYHCWLTPLGVRSTTERRERENCCVIVL